MNYSRRRRSWWKPIAAIALALSAGVVLWRFLPVTRTFDAFEMHGGPVVVDRPTDPSVVLLTSHWETPRYTSTRYAFRNKSTLHWDVWAYNANDLSRRWVVRVASIRQGQRNLEQQRRAPHTQNFALGLRYQLWAAPLRDTVNRFRNAIRVPIDYAPRAASPEFLQGGLLTMADANGREGVVGITKPTRFIVVHQDRIDAASTQTVTCIGLDGTVCWNAPLNVSIATGFVPLAAGGPSQWALMVVGESTDNPKDSGMPSVTRVAINTGAISQMRFASVDLAALVGELTPHRRR